jgi:hypothetical protein
MQEWMYRMKTIFFTIKEKVTVKRQELLLSKIRQWPKVASVGRIISNDKNPAFRMCWIRLEAGADAPAVCQALRKLKSIESAEEPAERHLV